MTMMIHFAENRPYVYIYPCSIYKDGYGWPDSQNLARQDLREILVKNIYIYI